MSSPSVPFAKTGVSVAKISHGLMTMTLRMPVIDDETAFATLKSSMDAVEPGTKMILNSAEFYGFNPPTANLELLNRFFAKYPEYSEKCIVAVKGAFNWSARTPLSSSEDIRASVENIVKILGPNKTLDHFEPARLDPEVPVEETVAALKSLQTEGLFKYIGLSEVKAETLRRASKAGTISSVEIEVSPWAYSKEVKDLIAAAKELDVAVLAYGPIGHGFLTGDIEFSKLDDSDWRKHNPRFAADAQEKNKVIVDAITKLAKRKGVSNAQLCIAWVGSLGEHVIPLPGWSSPSRTAENLGAVNVLLTAEEKEELEDAIEGFEATGLRYPEGHAQYLMV